MGAGVGLARDSAATRAYRAQSALLQGRREAGLVGSERVRECRDQVGGEFASLSEPAA